MSVTATRAAAASARLVYVVSLVTLLSLVPLSRAARADVVGRLRLAVKNADDEKPVKGATVVLHDSAGVRADVTVTTDETGTVTTPPLENRAWHVTTKADLFQNDERDVTVAADATTEVEVLLEPLKEKVVTIKGLRNIVRSGDTSSSQQRSQTFLKKYPATAGNPQSLSKALRTVPGFVEDSANQAHPRGEHASTSVYINGFLLPGALQGRAGQFLSPEAVQTLDVQTGAYAPEYGGETAAILNLTLRSGTIQPFADARLGGGGFGTFDGGLTFGGQGGAPLDSANAAGAKKFGYLVNLSQRNTDNALEPPQPDNQTAHNHQDSTTGFGNFTFAPTARDQFAVTLNFAPARTQVANRTGLSDFYAPYGQGYGYAGALSKADADAAGIKSQQDDGQDIYQKDTNGFGTLQYRKQFSDSVTGLFTYGYSKSKLEIRNNNPNNGAVVDPGALPADSSIEFSPTIVRDYNQNEIQGNLTFSQNPQHTFKIGILYADQSGRESYQLIPGSQAALSALYNTDPRLAPQGGTAVTDANGDTTYSLANPTATPTLSVKRSGHYAAAYAQDTWKASRKVTVNYGFRIDNYQAKQDLGQDEVKKTEFSPRLNTAFVVAPLTVFRLSYDHLFTQPPLAQGAILGDSIKPQTSDQYEASIEKQFGGNQTVKLAYYDKENRNQLDTGILIEGTQIGAYTTVNLGKSTIKGTELSYELTPRNDIGLGAYASWANTVAKPRGLDNLGEPITDAYNDHDQLNTISGGLNYTWINGVNVGTNVYYGSGVFSSILTDGGKRQPRTEVSLRVSTGPRLIKSGVGLDLAVENLFDSRERINYQSAFSGTRFQQGRRVLLSLTGRF